MSRYHRRRAAAAVMAFAALAAGAPAVTAPAQPAKPATPATPVAQQTFATPEKAMDALASAWRTGHASDLLAIFGPAGVSLARSGDHVADRLARRRMAAAYDAAHRIELQGTDKAVLVLGEAQWPYPIPLVKHAGAWRFDVKAGARQIIDRRIGRNEIHVIGTARRYVEAQAFYAARLAAHGGKREFAQRIASAPGQRDGLYWPTANGDEESPLGPMVAIAEMRGYQPPTDTDHQPYEGYIFRVLTAQGEHAPGGARSYLADGHMTGGFALVAYPARYGDSGIMTFIVNQDGIVWERNLGPDTARQAPAITAYDPGSGWRVSEP